MTTSSVHNRDLLLVFRVGLQDELADPVLCGDLSDWAKEREAPAFPIDRVLASREGNVSSVPATTLPDAEADKLESTEDTVGEVQLGIRELTRRVSPVVWDDLDNYGLVSGCGGAPPVWR